jgi:hypothetical protein
MVSVKDLHNKSETGRKDCPFWSDVNEEGLDRTSAESAVFSSLGITSRE